jgi:OOP family OmpA-OmpF porin
MRLEAERYRINDAVGNKGDVDLFSVGLVYRFGEKTRASAPRAEPAAARAPLPVVVTPPPPPAPAVTSPRSAEAVTPPSPPPAAREPRKDRN